MGNNESRQIGERIFLIDPNDFENQYAGNSFDDRFNMSVPNEDLSILVELRTQTKDRTILVSGQGVKNQNGITVSFLSGNTSNQTGNESYLTTRYTELNTELTSINESFGISSIDIEFNSSYAPMITINFIDVRGGAIFQTGGDSPYNVFFRLPYPLFELKVKGFYGKPVTYCLHLTKFNSRFNSQTGNFEITANFVGYTYALLSDMIIGYLKAAAITPRGKELISASNTISINDFLSIINSIDGNIGDLLGGNNEETNNLSIIKNLKVSIDDIRIETDSTIKYLNASTKYPTYESGDANIVIVKDLNSGDNLLTISDTENIESILPSYKKKLDSAITNFNSQISNTELKINTNLNVIVSVITVKDLFNNEKVLRDDIARRYGVEKTNNILIDNIIDRLKLALKNVSKDSNELVKIYDFTEIKQTLTQIQNSLNNEEIDVSKKVALNLSEKLKSTLGFESNIRNIFKLFTTHVEIFLEQIFEVSSQYTSDVRNRELEKIKSQFDIKSNTPIYPWPEYHELNANTNVEEEKYLGSKNGPLANPLNVPEVKFVEDLYEAMIKSEEILRALGEETNKTSWYSTNPADSPLSITTKPYDRLNDNAVPDDIALLATLRAAAYLGFSNKLLTKEEIEAFATNDAILILNKYGSSFNIIKGLGQKYNTPDSFSNITGVINGKSQNVFTNNNNNLRYDYIDEATNDRYILPLDKGFNNVTYTLKDETASDIKLSSRTCDKVRLNILDAYYEFNDTAKYIDFLNKEEYENNSSTSPVLENSIFNLTGLKTQSITKADELKTIGFKSNAGKYGTQEFTIINYDSSDYVNAQLPFYTLLYDNVTNKYATTISTVRTNKTLDDWDLLSVDNKEKKFITPNLDGLKFENLYSSLDKLYDNHKNLGNTIENLKLGEDVSSFPFLNYLYIDLSSSVVRGVPISLFGSRFFNAQNVAGQAYLFLHSFPWRGIANKFNERFQFGDVKEITGIFRQPEILNVFQYRTGYIQVPKLFPAFIGALLWRYESGGVKKNGDKFISDLKNLEIKGKDPISFNEIGKNTKIPTTFSYMKSDNSAGNLFDFLTDTSTISLVSSYQMSFTNNPDAGYITIDDVLINLPTPIKQKFIDEFNDFVYNEFSSQILPVFEIIPKSNNLVGGDAAWSAAWLSLRNDKVNTLSGLERNISLRDNVKISDRYSVFTYINTDNSLLDYAWYNYILEYKEGSDANNKLKELLFDYKYIANYSYRPWQSNTDCYAYVDIPKAEVFDIYMNALINRIKTNIEEKEKKLFNNLENEPIKLEIYRTCKKIYDKWIGGLDSPDKVLFQCCTVNKSSGKPDRLATDKGNKLIDSFRFVSRGFKDIGDQFQINPLIVNNILKQSTNVSFYDLVSRILTENNFDFVALPNFIDYSNPKEINNIFEPYPYYLAQKDTPTGPSFVCIYVGQTSTKLDFKNSDYPNDSFNFADPCIGCPPDIIGGVSGETGQSEDKVPVFVVRYGQQNQNFFKDVVLDQSEFSETAESLQVTDAIANSFSQTNQNYVAQNLYNVYTARSYKAEVEMMGNAMIQPMMYFQLDNIPMFRGAYLITKVKHSIQPNHMSTVFTGTRIAKVATPLLDAATLYSTMLQGYNLGAPKSGSTLTTTVSGNFPPIVRTILENGGTNAKIDNGTGNITLKPVPKIDFVYNEKINETNGQANSLLAEASDALVKMLNDFVLEAKKNNYKTFNNSYIGITSLYRNYEKQKSLYDDDVAKNNGKKSGAVAEPGSSNHGWGIAVDLHFVGRNGEFITNTTRNNSVGFSYETNPSLKWFVDNSYKYGFIIPQKLRDNSQVDEFWHFEYHGTAAKCLLEKHPYYRNNKADVTKNYDSVVLNPLGKDNKRAVYLPKDCGYIYYTTADGSEAKSTNLSGNFAQNQLIVKDYLKKIYANNPKAKEITAGIMGNIQVESGFNPTIGSKDTNGYKSYGLIQWNAASYPKAENKVGNTAQQQVIKIVDGYTYFYTDFLKAADSQVGLTPYKAAYLFAKNVERCAGCLDEISFQNKQSSRGEYANDFYRRFNTSGDLLFW